MKHLSPLLFVLIFSMRALAQESDADLSRPVIKKITRPAKPPVCYIGLSSGINNPSGVFGFDVNIRLSKYVTFDGGAGASTWGNKLFAGAKYYLKDAHRGFAFGGGLTFNSGEENAKLRVETANEGIQKVTMQFKPQPNVFVAAYHYWNLGKRYNRFFVELGKSVPLHSVHYHEVYGPQLSDRSNETIKRLAPGGLMFGAGFSFGLYRL